MEEVKHKGKFTKCILSACPNYWITPARQIKKDFNGIGPENCFINLIPKFIRNSILFADFGEIGYIHDHRYQNKTNFSNYKFFADLELLNNGCSLARYHRDNPSWFARTFVNLEWLYKRRMKRVLWYYSLCKDHGDSYFSTGIKSKLCINNKTKMR